MLKLIFLILAVEMGCKGYVKTRRWSLSFMEFLGSIWAYTQTHVYRLQSDIPQSSEVTLYGAVVGNNKQLVHNRNYIFLLAEEVRFQYYISS